MTNLLNRKMDFIHSVDDRFHNFLKMDTSYPVKLNGLVQKMFIATADYRIKDDNTTATPYSSEITFSIQNSTGDTICDIKHEDVYGIDGKHLSDKAFITGDYVMALIDLENQKIFIFSFCNASNINFNGIRELDYKCNGKDDNVILPSVIEFINNFNYTLTNGTMDSSEFKANIDSDSLNKYVYNSTVRINIIGKFGIDYSKTKMFYESGSIRRNRSSIMSISTQLTDNTNNVSIVIDWGKCSIPRILYNNHTCAALYNTVETSPTINNEPIYYDFFLSKKNTHTGGAHFKDTQNRPYGNLFPRRLTFFSIDGLGYIDLTFNNFNLVTFGQGIYIEHESDKSFTLNDSKITISDNMSKYKYLDTRFLSNGRYGKFNNKSEYCDQDLDPETIVDKTKSNQLFCLTKPRFIGPAININSARCKVSIKNSKIVSDRKNKTHVQSLIINSSANAIIDNTYIENYEVYSKESNVDMRYVFKTVPIEAEYSYINRYVSYFNNSADTTNTRTIYTNTIRESLNYFNASDVINDDNKILDYNMFETYIADQIFYNSSSSQGLKYNMTASPMMFSYVVRSTDLMTNGSYASGFSLHILEKYDNLKLFDFKDIVLFNVTSIDRTSIETEYGGKIVPIQCPIINNSETDKRFIIYETHMDCKANNLDNPGNVFSGAVKNIPIVDGLQFVKTLSKDNDQYNYEFLDKDQERLNRYTTLNGRTVTFCLKDTNLTNGIYDINKETEYMPRLNISNSIFNAPSVIYQESANTTINSSFINSVTKYYNSNAINIVSGTIRLDSTGCLYDTRELKYFYNLYDKDLELAFIKLYNPTIRDFYDDPILTDSKDIDNDNNFSSKTDYRYNSVRNNTSRYQSVVLLTTPSCYISNCNITLLPGIMFNCPSFDSLGDTILDNYDNNITESKFRRNTETITGSARILFRHAAYDDPDRTNDSYKYVDMEPVNSSNKNILSFISSSRSKFDNEVYDGNSYDYNMPYNSVLSTKVFLDNSNFNVADSFSYTEAFSMYPQMKRHNFYYSNNNNANNYVETSLYDSYGVVVRLGSRITYTDVFDDIREHSLKDTYDSFSTINYVGDSLYSSLTGYEYLMWLKQNIVIENLVQSDGTTLQVAKSLNGATYYYNVLCVSSTISGYPDSMSFVVFDYMKGRKVTVVCKTSDLNKITSSNDIIACYVYQLSSISSNSVLAYHQLGYFNYLEAYLLLAHNNDDYTTTPDNIVYTKDRRYRSESDNTNLWNNITYSNLSQQDYSEHVYIAPINGTNIHQTALYQYDYLTDMSLDTYTDIRKKFTTFGVIGFKCYNTNFHMTNCQVGSNPTGYARNTYGVESLVKRAPRIAFDFYGNGNYNISNSNINAWATTIWSNLYQHGKDVIESMVPRSNSQKYSDSYGTWKGTHYPVDFTTISLSDYGSVNISQCNLVNFSAFRYSCDRNEWNNYFKNDKYRAFSHENSAVSISEVRDMYSDSIITAPNIYNNEYIINGNEMPIVYIGNIQKSPVTIDQTTINGNETLIASGNVSVTNSNYVNVGNAIAFYVNNNYTLLNDIDNNYSKLSLKNNVINCIKDNVNDYYIDRYKGYYLLKKSPFISNLSHKGMEKYGNCISPIHVVYGNIIDCSDNDINFTVLTNERDQFIIYSTKLNILYYDYKKIEDIVPKTKYSDQRTQSQKIERYIRIYLNSVMSGKIINFTNNNINMYFQCLVSDCVTDDQTRNESHTCIIPAAEDMSIIRLDNKMYSGRINVANNNIDNKLILTTEMPFCTVSEYWNPITKSVDVKANMYTYNKFGLYANSGYDYMMKYMSFNDNMSLVSPYSVKNSTRLVGNFIDYYSYIQKAVESGSYDYCMGDISRKCEAVRTIYDRSNVGTVFPDKKFSISESVFSFNGQIVRYDTKTNSADEYDNNSLISTCHTPLLYISDNEYNTFEFLKNELSRNVYIDVVSNNINNYQDNGIDNSGLASNERMPIIGTVQETLSTFIDITSLCDIAVQDYSDSEYNSNINISNNSFTNCPRSIVLQPYKVNNEIIPFILRPSYNSTLIGCYGFAIAVNATVDSNNIIKTIPIDTRQNIEKFTDKSYYIKNDPELGSNQAILNNNLNTDSISITVGADNTYDLLLNCDYDDSISDAVNNNSVKINPVLDNNNQFSVYPTFGALYKYKTYDAYNYIQANDNMIISFPSMLAMIYDSVTSMSTLNPKLFVPHVNNDLEDAFEINRYGSKGIVKRYDLKYIPVMMFPTRSESYIDNLEYTKYNDNICVCSDLNNAKYNGLRVAYFSRDDIETIVEDNYNEYKRNKQYVSKVFDPNLTSTGGLNENLNWINYLKTDDYLKTWISLNENIAEGPNHPRSIPIFYPDLVPLNTYQEDAGYAMVAKKVTYTNGGGNTSDFDIFNLIKKDSEGGIDIHFGSIYSMPIYSETDISATYTESQTIYRPTIQFTKAFMSNNSFWKNADSYFDKTTAGMYAGFLPWSTRNCAQLANVLACLTGNSQSSSLKYADKYYPKCQILFTPHDISFEETPTKTVISVPDRPFNMLPTKGSGDSETKFPPVTTKNVTYSNSEITIYKGKDQYQTTMKDAYTDLIKYTDTSTGTTYVYLGYYEFPKYTYKKFGTRNDVSVPIPNINGTFDQIKNNQTHDIYLMNYNNMNDVSSSKNSNKVMRRVHFIKEIDSNGNCNRIFMKYNDSHNGVGNVNISTIMTDTDTYKDYCPFSQDTVGVNLEKFRIAVRGSAGLNIDGVSSNNTYVFLHNDKCIDGVMPFNNSIIIHKNTNKCADMAQPASSGHDGNRNFYNFHEENVNGVIKTIPDEYTNKYIINVRTCASVSYSLANRQSTISDSVDIWDLCTQIPNFINNNDNYKYSKTNEKTVKNLILSFIYCTQDRTGYNVNLFPIEERTVQKKSASAKKYDLDHNSIELEWQTISATQMKIVGIKFNMKTSNDGGLIFKRYLSTILTNRDHNTASQYIYQYIETTGLDYNGIPLNAVFYSPIQNAVAKDKIQVPQTHVVDIGSVSNIYGSGTSIGDLDNYFVKVDIYGPYKHSNNTKTNLIDNSSLLKNGNIDDFINNATLNGTREMQDSYFMKLIDATYLYRVIYGPKSSLTNASASLSSASNFYTRVREVFKKSEVLNISYYGNSNIPIYGAYSLTKKTVFDIIPYHIFNHCPLYTFDDIENAQKDSIQNIMSILLNNLNFDSSTYETGVTNIRSNIGSLNDKGVLPNYSDNLVLGKTLDEDSVIPYSVKLTFGLDDLIYNSINYKSIRAIHLNLDNDYAMCTFDSNNFQTEFSTVPTRATALPYYNLVIPYSSIDIDSGDLDMTKWVPSLNHYAYGYDLDGNIYNTIMRGIRKNKILLDASTFVESEFKNGTTVKSKTDKPAINLYLNLLNINITTRDNNANLK